MTSLLSPLPSLPFLPVLSYAMVWFNTLTMTFYAASLTLARLFSTPEPDTYLCKCKRLQLLLWASLPFFLLDKNAYRRYQVYAS
ncbi:hypothetical protein F5B22DRAFT_110453 [Xylaria bambusicola]|uniref:uncharacterized protein n=1 Tax=Xylaria bambusicola TaxID=326684 RepID=UPI002008E998|nr:uncharacterized protein F5B22DRAFT_110453 [Xylaria bambusicola]KAI0517584.1 hypothetical protein F5B22DRAFT_110453 [Xylaria bambusicola]